MSMGSCDDRITLYPAAPLQQRVRVRTHTWALRTGAVRIHSHTGALRTGAVHIHSRTAALRMGPVGHQNHCRSAQPMSQMGHKPRRRSGPGASLCP
jgi:hypothetical protein